jgi:uncharacterized protein (TIGR00269 family)
LSRITPFLKGVPGWLIPRVKPLYHIIEKDLRLYSQLLGLPVHHPPCRYKETSLRNEIREWLNTFEDQHTGSKFNLHASFMKIIHALQTETEIPFQKCQRCGELTSQAVCAVCLHREALGFSSPKKK